MKALHTIDPSRPLTMQIVDVSENRIPPPSRRYHLTDALILAAKLEHNKAMRGIPGARENFVGYSRLAVGRTVYVTTATHDCLKMEDGDRRWIMPEKD